MGDIDWSTEIDWTTEPGVDPVFRAAILWWHQRTGGSGFEDVYAIEEFLAHIRPLIAATESGRADVRATRPHVLPHPTSALRVDTTRTQEQTFQGD